jgi:hypothetical protein
MPRSLEFKYSKNLIYKRLVKDTAKEVYIEAIKFLRSGKASPILTQLLIEGDISKNTITQSGCSTKKFLLDDSLS